MLSSSERGLVSAIGVSRALLEADTSVSGVVEHLATGNYGWTTRACRRAIKNAGARGLARSLQEESERADSPLARRFLSSLATAHDTGTSPREELDSLFSQLIEKKKADTKEFIEKATLAVNIVLVLVLAPLIAKSFSLLWSLGIGGDLSGLVTLLYETEMVLIGGLAALLWGIKPEA